MAKMGMCLSRNVSEPKQVLIRTDRYLGLDRKAQAGV